MMVENAGKLKVLITEDDQPTRMLLRASIVQWDYEVLEAEDGQEAWNILQQEQAPHILLLDWLMPKMDGVTLCERIIEEYEGPRPYIILLSNVSGTNNILKGLNAGADEFLFKPFNISELRARLLVGSRIIRYRNRLVAEAVERLGNEHKHKS